MKQRLLDLYTRLFPPVQPLPPGIYTYQAPAGAPRPYRLHLRIEPGGDGILIVNASTVLHLNPTAAEYACYFIQGRPETEIVALMGKRYRVSRDQAIQDYRELIDRIDTLIQTPDLDPVTFLNFERAEPHAAPLTAPLRIDCALTYRQSDDGDEHAAPLERVRRELLSEEWKTILDKAWNAGIPHVIFTGGEPTTRPDLPELIAHAESLGMVAGLITNGLRLSETHYLHQLLQSGLDHLMILLDPSEEQSWEAVRDALAEDIFTTIHLTLTRRLLDSAKEILTRLAAMGCTSLSLSAESNELKDHLSAAREHAAHLGLTLVWDLPVPYSRFHPVALELSGEETRLEGAGRSWVYVEPDGDVLPGQGVQKTLGNLLTDPWEQIWANARE